MSPVVILFGLGVGVMVGTTGAGGGSLMTPLLILVLKTQPVIAVGTDLAYAAVTKTVGGWRHWRKGTVDLGLSLWLAVGSIPGALGGVVVLDRLHAAFGKHAFDDFVLVFVAAALLLTSVAVLARAMFLTKLVARERDSIPDFERRHKLAAVAIGLSVGFVLGVTSAGSGSLIAVGLIMVYRLAPKRVVGTDVFHAAILLWVAAGAHLISGNVDLGLAGNILIGSIPGVWIGAALSSRLPDQGLRPTLGVVLLASGLALLYKAGAQIPVAAIFAVPVGIGLWALALHVRRLRAAPRLAEPNKA